MSLSDLAQLQQILAEKNPEASLALRLALPEHQPKLFALFIIFHEAYEACTETKEPMVGKIKLAWWRERIEEIMAVKLARPHPALLALGQDFEYYAGMLSILDEFEKLLDEWQPRNFSEIESFIYVSFGELFAICGKISSSKNAQEIGFCYGNLYLLRKFRVNQNMFFGSEAAAKIAVESFEKNLNKIPQNKAYSAFGIIIKHYQKNQNSKRWKLLLQLFFRAKSAL